jgi:RNA polymerase sigma-70 factor (ECF subfamily)
MGMMEHLATAQDVIQSGASFEDLFATHRDKLFSAMWLVARDRHEAEDLTQEAFVRVWERWDRSGAPDDPAGYLYRTAMNLFLNRRRRAAVAARRILRIEPRPDELAAVEARDEVRRALRALTHAQRAALVLLDLVDLSSEDAARVLGVRPSTVRVLAARGRAALATELGDHHV